MTDQQIANYQQTFGMIDKNGDGKIDASELLQAMQQLGYKNISQKVANEMLVSVDKDGKWSFECFQFDELYIYGVDQKSLMVFFFL